MEEESLQKKNRKLVELLCWILIGFSALVLLKSIFSLQGYVAMIKMQGITKKFEPVIGINFALYFFQSTVELILCVVVIISSTFVLKYKSIWRKVLIYGLITSVIFLLVSPLITYFNFSTVTIKVKGISGSELISVAKTTMLIASYTWSIIITAFLVYVIIKFSKEEVKLLFN